VPGPVAASTSEGSGDLRTSGLHTRAGNAMGRTRDGLLDGALASLELNGLRGTTMAGIAVRAGVAKATLYNHFRTREDLVRALVAREVERLALATRGQDLAVALAATGESLARMPAVRHLAETEPSALLPLLAPGAGAGWDQARNLLAEALGSESLGADARSAEVDVVLRWLVGLLLQPPDPGTIHASAAVLAASCALTPAGSEDTRS
jgi:AcrR family transcriptional regulator